MGDTTWRLILSFYMAKGCEALYFNALDIWDSAMLCYVINEN